MNLRLFTTVGAMALALLSQPGYATLITFTGYVSLTTPTIPPQFSPSVWQGLELDPYLYTLQAGRHYVPFPSGTQALQPATYFSPSTTFRAVGSPFILNSVEMAPAYIDNQAFGDIPHSVTLTGYFNGAEVGQSVVNFPSTDHLFHVYASAFSGPVDTLYFSTGPWFIDALDVTPVPEPETWCLLGIGLAAMAAQRRHGKKSRAG